MDHVYLTENSEDASLLPQLQDFISDGFLTFRTAPRPWFQQTIYLECMQQHRHKHNWMAFIDLDEFIVLRKCAPAPHSAARTCCTCTVG